MIYFLIMLILINSTISVKSGFQKGLQKKMNLTILMVSHDIGTVTTYVDEISCLNINLYYHGNPLGALNDKVMTSLYGKNFDLLTHTDSCDKCERLRP